MEELILIRPEMKYTGQLADYKRECLECGSHIDGGGALRRIEDTRDYIEQCVKNEKGEGLPAGKVPSTQFMLVRVSDDRVLGLLNVRHYLNEDLEKWGGHIGYSVRPCERRRGYAKVMLKMALPYCKSIGLDRVLVTCHDGNIGSERTILANGGIYENSVYVPGEGAYIKRFWIEL